MTNETTIEELRENLIGVAIQLMRLALRVAEVEGSDKPALLREVDKLYSQRKLNTTLQIGLTHDGSMTGVRLSLTHPQTGETMANLFSFESLRAEVH